MIALHDRVGRAVAAEECCIVEISSPLFHELHDKFPSDFGLLVLNLAREMARNIREVSNILAEQKIFSELKSIL